MDKTELTITGAGLIRCLRHDPVEKNTFTYLYPKLDFRDVNPATQDRPIRTACPEMREVARSFREEREMIQRFSIGIEAGAHKKVIWLPIAHPEDNVNCYVIPIRKFLLEDLDRMEWVIDPGFMGRDDAEPPEGIQSFYSFGMPSSMEPFMDIEYVYQLVANRMQSLWDTVSCSHPDHESPWLSPGKNRYLIDFWKSPSALPELISVLWSGYCRTCSRRAVGDDLIPDL